jgi:N-acetylglutamate synthase-like GNAT family acetyltransferase
MKVVEVRTAVVSDLPEINYLIDKAVMNWAMPARLKRLASPILLYDRVDLEELRVFVATFNGQVVGIAACDIAPLQVLPNGPGGLFHGLYVLPLIQGQGVGKKLMLAVFHDAKCHQVNGLLIKAQRVSKNYFAHQGMQTLSVDGGEYPCKYWKALA